MTSILSYTSEGQGKPLVFIHGFCETTEIWHYFKNYFTRGYQVICVDLPGFGGSKGIKDQTSIENFAISLNTTLKSIGIEKPILIGHSLGGYVALAYAEMYPSEMAGMCMFHSTVFEDLPEKKENRNKTIDYVEKHGVDAFCNPFVPGLFFHKRRDELKEQIQYVLQIARKTSLESIVNTTRAMRDRKDRTHVISQLQFPVAYIIGKEDTAVTFDKSLTQCHLASQSHVLFLGNTAHMGMFEREKECANFLLGFIQGIF
jgi:pimeloyl-ACP methyl ester carboxylesterase